MYNNNIKEIKLKSRWNEKFLWKTIFHTLMKIKKKPTCPQLTIKSENIA